MSDKPQVIQFFATAPYECSYLKGQTARSQVATPGHLIDEQVYAQLLAAGFRRSGLFTYKPHCRQCDACQTLRIPVQEFMPNRSQRRTWSKQAHQLQARVVPPEFQAEHFALYQRYLAARHSGAGMDQESAQDYQSFLLSSHVDTQLVEFHQWDEEAQTDVLRMVSVIDVQADSLSAVYTFYDPQQPSAAYGSYGVLWLIDLARRAGLRYVYLGYWISQSQKMAYKASFLPHEILVQGGWTKVLKNSHKGGD